MKKNVGQRSRTRSINQRSGYTLVLVVMLLFGIMAMAALVIDIGFARLAQRQMQTAVDSAALEGLRFRDQRPPIPFSFDNESSRREESSQIVEWHFDDDLMADANDPRNFGAGPIVNFSGGAGDSNLNASQDMTIGASPTFKPHETNRLRPNPSNSSGGDMVGGGAFNYGDAHTESNDYLRNDFTTNHRDNDVFLVRMRRTGETSNDDSTSGPVLPYLFARGSLLNRQLVGAGIRVRATGIANARPVVCVGLQRTNALGPMGYAISLTEWNDNNLQALREFVGRVVGDGIGGVVSNPTTPVRGYVAIYDQINSIDRVIGFGLATISLTGFTKETTVYGKGLIAHENASAMFCVPIAATGPSISPNDAEQVVVANSRLSQRTDILFAPVSAR